jgi:hypothetical protein
MGEVDERYKRGQIYTIRCITDDTMIYVGSTINTLSKRFHKHKSDKNCSLYDYITENDWCGWYIELYEMYPCNSKRELERREGEIIREIGTINKNIAGRTIKEYSEEYYKKNADKIKEYYKDNKQEISEIRKEYYKKNADIMKERNDKNYEKYKEKYKEKRKEYQKEKVCCNICGTFITKVYIKRHQQSKKCIKIDINN